MAWKLAQSPLCDKLWAAPGNPGIAQHAECTALDSGNHDAVVSFCTDNAIALVVIGPEAPLVDGLADTLRAAGIDTFSGDILSEAAEQRVELVSYATLIAATDNDAYNTLVTTDLAPEFGRENVFQVMREKSESSRHQLPRTLGGRPLGLEATHAELRDLIAQGWRFRSTRLSEEFTLEDWRASGLPARQSSSGEIKFMRKNEEFKGGDGIHVIALRPPEE